MKNRPFFFALCVMSLLGAVLSGCSGDSSNSYGTPSSPTAPSSQPNTVNMSGMAFGPASLTVPRNTTVTWHNADAVTHTSTSDTGVWDTGDIAAGGSKTTTFATAGTFTYHCTHHPSMTGTIIVQ
jgi:plastocyanin